MPVCKFFTCTRNAVANNLCIGHQIYKDSGIEDPKPVKSDDSPAQKPDARKKAKKAGKTKIKKTPAQAKRERELAKMAKAERDAGNTDCQIMSEDCQGVFEGWHHIRKKTPSNYTDRKNLLRSCNCCNSFMESHSAWAIAQGFVKSKFTKNAN